MQETPILPWINIQFLSYLELGMFICNCACLVAWNGLTLSLPLQIIFEDWKLPALYICLGAMAFKEHGFRLHYVFGALRQPLFLIGYLLFPSFQPFFWLIYLLPLASVLFVLHASRIIVSVPHGKYTHIGHRESRVKTGNQTWISIYYPAKERQEKEPFDRFTWKEPEPMPGKPKRVLKYLPGGEDDGKALAYGFEFPYFFLKHMSFINIDADNNAHIHSDFSDSKKLTPIILSHGLMANRRLYFALI